MAKDSYQFSVTKTKKRTFDVIVQDYKEIIRSYSVSERDILNRLEEELQSLRPGDTHLE